MKNKILRSVTLLTLTGLVLSLTAWAISSVPQRDAQAAQSGGSKPKTLRELVRERDVEVDAPEGENNLEYDDLSRLARHAEAIVVGRITEEKSFFDGDDYIVTNYQLDVQRVLKHTRLNGPLGVGQEPPAPLVTPLKLARMGGVVQVNGRRASQKLKGSEPLKTGRDFLLFLWWSPAYKAYTLAGGVSGAFLIDGEQRLRPLGLKPGMRAYDGGVLQVTIDQVLENKPPAGLR
jgi:hypothetical protein